MSNFRCSNALFNGTIIINTTAGATVTATTTATSRTFTAVANAGGVATIPVKKRGTYAIASTGTTRIGHAEVLTIAPVTAVYTWKRYNSNYVYVEVNNGLWSGTIQLASSSVYYGINTTDTFNRNNGIYTINNGEWGTCDPRWGLYTKRAITNGQQSGGNLLRSDLGQLYFSRYSYSSPCYLASMGGTTTIYNMTSAGTYERGTYIDDKYGTTFTTYPANGRASDGYWYVEQ